MIHLERAGDVFVLRLDAGENRFGPEEIDQINRALDTVEKAGSPAALITTGTGKFYSNGLDLAQMAGGPAVADAYLGRVLAILGRVLTFPTTTVAAINGHAFGAGALLAAAHDFRLMRADRGFFCMPEVDMGVPLHPGMIAVLQARLPNVAVHEVIATGRRFGGADALERGIVDEAVSEAELSTRAHTIAGSLADKAKPAMGFLKRGLYGPALEALAKPLSSVAGLPPIGTSSAS